MNIQTWPCWACTHNPGRQIQVLEAVLCKGVGQALGWCLKSSRASTDDRLHQMVHTPHQETLWPEGSRKPLTPLTPAGS